MNLKDALQATEHPTKAIFKKAGIAQVTIARAIGKYPCDVSNYLSGRVKIPLRIEKMIYQLANEAEQMMKGGE